MDSSQLAEILKQHVLWIESDTREGKSADLERANLQGANLQKADLQGADLQGANLIEADLVKADLRKAHLGESNLQGADLRMANLEGANLQKANLQGANLRSDADSDTCFFPFLGADFQDADLRDANLQNTFLASSNLQGADLRKADLRKAHLGKANLQGANLQKANLQEAYLEEADLVEADLVGADFREADLQKANLQGADLVGADFREADLQKVDLGEANLQGANLGEANLQGVDLKRANLQGANLQKANLQGADLVEADLVGADFREADLQKVDLQGADLKRANFWSANLIQANLTKTNIIATNFDKAVLDGVDLKKARLIEVSLQIISMKDAILESITIDQNSISQIPKDLQEKYSKTWFDIQEQYNENFIRRSIEFPPEYHQAGISILNYFGTFLREKYPEKKVKIRIEQENLKVTLIIETSSGDREIIEKTLNDYGLVVTGQKNPEEFLNNRLEILKLENKLELVKHELKMEQKISKIRDLDVEKLYSLIHDAFSQKGNIITYNPPNIIVSPVITAQISQNFQIDSQITLMQSGLNELIEELPEGSEEQNDIKSIQKSLENIEKCQSPNKIKKSSAMSKIRRFLEDLGQDDSKIGNAIKGLKSGVKIAQNLAEYYNGIAQWCGLPSVPKPFLKKKFDD